jgi:hypothetical protein
MSLADFDDIVQICNHWDETVDRPEVEKMQKNLSSVELGSTSSRSWEILEEKSLLEKKERETALY